MTDQFVTYEIAKRLKELGFNEPCFMYKRFAACGQSDLAPELVKTLKTTNSGLAAMRSENWITLPLWQQCIDWLRIEHGYALTVFPSQNLWDYTIHNANSFHSEYFDSYEQAREAAILKALELIK